MTKFTPGPWRVEVDMRIDTDLNGHPRGEEYISGYDIYSDNICIVGCEGILGDSEANARLIAAAPDMYAALQLFIIGANVSYVTALEIARAAIAKADGATT